MKSKARIIKSWSWLIIFVITDLFFIFLVYIISPQSFYSVAAAIILFSILAVFAGIYFETEHRRKKKELFEKFLEYRDKEAQCLLESEEEPELKDSLIKLGTTLRGQEQKLYDKETELKAYQEYIESWAHEVKTPLSLAVLVLDNHKDEMSPYVYKRMGFVRHCVESDVERILYYARLRADHPDFKLERISLKDAVCESLEDFQLIAQENKTSICLNLSPATAVTDKKILHFMISQLLSNAFKYTAKEFGKVEISTLCDEAGTALLIISDNGSGVSKEDLPFIFDRGFTGSSAERQKATGMGLYLVKKYADALTIRVDAENIIDNGGFKTTLSFPEVK